MTFAQPKIQQLSTVADQLTVSTSKARLETIENQPILGCSTVDCNDFEFEIEVDAVPDEDFGDLYRVWLGTTLLGTFYKSIASGWNSHLWGTGNLAKYDKSDAAIDKIVESYLEYLHF